MNRTAYKDNGAAILWWDESESGNNFGFIIPEIVTHSSDLKTIQELFNVSATSATGFLGDAGSAATSDLFAPGTTAQGLPEPATLSVLGIALTGLHAVRRSTSPKSSHPAPLG